MNPDKDPEKTDSGKSHDEPHRGSVTPRGGHPAHSGPSDGHSHADDKKDAPEKHRHEKDDHSKHEEHGKKHARAEGHDSGHRRATSEKAAHGGAHKAGQPKEHKEPPPKPIKGRTVFLIGLGLLVFLGIVFVIGFLIHHARVVKREKMAKEIREKPPVVSVVSPKVADKAFELALPADVHPYAMTSLYARTNGFLASWHFDINDRVKKGDVLAVISAPDTDADLEQAKASLGQAQTNQQLASATEDRYRGLIPIQGVTQEQLDQVKSSREQAQSNVKSSNANVDRLKALVGFEKIVAPFDGVVTARNFDVGALISATATGASDALFVVQEDDKLRVDTNVPQAYSLMIQYGQEVELSLERNYPGYRFKGTVVRSAGSLDPVTRTLKTELVFTNTDPKRKLYPGMYGQAIFSIHRDQPVLSIPTSALLIEPEGNEVAVVVDQSKIHLQKVVLGSDFGTDIEVLSGLKAEDKVVANPGERIAEGVKVTVQTPKDEKADASNDGGKDKGDEKSQGDDKDDEKGKAKDSDDSKEK